jgi:hypothetical protein
MWRGRGEPCRRSPVGAPLGAAPRREATEACAAASGQERAGRHAGTGVAWTSRYEEQHCAIARRCREPLSWAGVRDAAPGSMAAEHVGRCLHREQRQQSRNPLRVVHRPGWLWGAGAARWAMISPGLRATRALGASRASDGSVPPWSPSRRRHCAGAGVAEGRS